MCADSRFLKRTVSGEVRLPDPIDDAILTLGVRMRDPLSYQEIASAFGIAHDNVSKICEPYKELLRTTGEDGPALTFARRSPREAVRPRAMWENAAFGNSGRESFQKQQIVNGADRLAGPVEDAVLTLGVRLTNPLSYEEIASLLQIAHEDASRVCKPYREFMRKAGEYGVRGVTRTE